MPAAAAVSRLPSWPAELVLLVAVYIAYSLGRLLADGDAGSAAAHGARLATLDRSLWLPDGLELNAWLQNLPVVAVAASYWYTALHYTVTPAVLVWLHRRHPGSYRSARTALVVATLLGLIGFWLYPAAPPRLLHGSGFVDTLASFSDWGWWSTDASAPRGLGGLTNELAAMPSLHVGWALWVGWYVATRTRRRLIRILAVAYPVVTALVVVATANHYWLDVVAGAGLVGAVIGVTTLVERRKRARAAQGAPA